MSYADAPTVLPELRAIVTNALAEALPEQGVDPDRPLVLHDTATQRRAGALDSLALAGRRVIDLGAGIGDVSRAARRGGAELVDAIERDGRRVELGRLLDVLQGVERISWFEGDAGLASTYSDEYDVIFAYGPALEAMRPILPRIVQNLRGVFVHELAEGADGADLGDLTDLLPARRELVAADGDGVSIVVCASEAAILRQHLADRGSAASAEVTS